MKLFQNLILLVLLFLYGGCKDEYLPDISATETELLIVEGLLNTGPIQTTISLSRTVQLSDTVVRKPEMGAQLFVVSSSGENYPLNETGPGQYTIASLPISEAETCHLNIQTSNGSQYRSDELVILTNPPIDSINWRRDADGVNLYVNTKKANAATGYYRWEYDETWLIRSVYGFSPLPGIVEDDGIFEPLYPGESYYYCWKTYKSSNIILASSERLSSNTISEKKLVFIPNGSDKLSERYRLRVRQYVLDKAGYEFYKLMEKNTESLGSIFDSQPTEIGGNIHAVSNNTAPAIGYITASSSNTDQIYINDIEVPFWTVDVSCTQTITVNIRDVDLRMLFPGQWLPISADMSGNIGLARRECVSCRWRGGSTHRPIDWE